MLTTVNNVAKEMKKNLILPVEVYRREFSAKLYLALKAARRGYDVLILEHSINFHQSIKNGFILYKDHAGSSEGRVNVWRQNGFRLGFLDEEGIIYKSEKAYLDNRVSKELIECADVIFFWGEIQRELVKKKANGNFKIVGNPRFDLLNLAKCSRDSSVKDRILINTRFVSCNGMRGYKAELENLRALGVLKTPKDINDYENFVEEDKKIFDGFISLIARIAEIGRFKVTVRPHPAENSDYYTEHFRSFINVDVDNSTELVSQITNHDLVIHDGCTTAIEAAALGIPVIGYRPKHSCLDYGHLPNLFSMNFDNEDSLIDFLNCADIDRLTPMIRFSEPNKLIANWSFSNCATSIIDAIDELDCIPSSVSMEFFKSRNSRWLNFKASAKKIANMIGVHGRQDKIDQQFDMSDHKFPALDVDQLGSLVADLCQMDNSLGVENSFIIKKLDHKVLFVSARN